MQGDSNLKAAVGPSDDHDKSAGDHHGSLVAKQLVELRREQGLVSR